MCASLVGKRSAAKTSFRNFIDASDSIGLAPTGNNNPSDQTVELEPTVELKRDERKRQEDVTSSNPAPNLFFVNKRGKGVITTSLRFSMQSPELLVFVMDAKNVPESSQIARDLTRARDPSKLEFGMLCLGSCLG